MSLFCCSNQQKGVIEEIKKQEDVPLHDTIKPKNDSVMNEVKVQKFNVSGHVIFTNSYCGGARPSDEMLESYETEYPLTNSTILLKQAEQKGKSIKITTDKKGNFQANLNPGTYDYFMTEKYSKNMGASFSSSCDVWLKRCFGQIKITEKKGKGYKLFFGFGCNPCEPPRP